MLLGTIPTTFDRLTALMTLTFASTISGTIGRSLLANASQIQQLTLGDSPLVTPGRLSGTLPPSISSMSRVVNFGEQFML